MFSKTGFGIRPLSNGAKLISHLYQKHILPCLCLVFKDATKRIVISMVNK